MRRPVVLVAAVAGLAAASLVAPATAQAGQGRGHHHGPSGPVRPSAPKRPVMTGAGGAVASVDDVATQVGIDVLKQGGNAADAAVAAAATLGVTEPFSSGIGGGGYLVYYDAKRRRVEALDGRETAPSTFTSTTFTDSSGKALDFTTVVSSGLSIGVPGTPAGATIITTVTQVLTEYLDRGLPLVQAIAAPRLSSRNGVEEAEPAIYDGPQGDALRALGHVLKANPEIGAATGIVLRRDGTFQAAAEPTRRGGGSAMVVRPRR